MPPSKQADVWDQRYSKAGFAFGDQPNEFLEQHEGLFHPGQTALSLGEGEGRNAVWLASRIQSITAVDLSPVAMNRLQTRAADANLPITAVEADLSQWELTPDHWDVVISIWCHMPSQVRSRVHRAVVEGLRPHGIFLLEAYAPDQIQRGTGGPSDPDFLATANALKEDLQGLTILSLQTLVRDVYEGEFHRGVADVVQLIARKDP